jgi:hypothetical protein
MTDTELRFQALETEIIGLKSRATLATEACAKALGQNELLIAALGILLATHPKPEVVIEATSRFVEERLADPDAPTAVVRHLDHAWREMLGALLAGTAPASL